MLKSEAVDLIESGYWDQFLKVTFNEFKTERISLFTSRDLTDGNRMFYIGSLAGVYRVIRKTYEIAEIAIPDKITEYFKGEWHG